MLSVMYVCMFVGMYVCMSVRCVHIFIMLRGLYRMKRCVAKLLLQHRVIVPTANFIRMQLQVVLMVVFLGD